MDLNKSLEFFNPNKVKRRCHIIGCGAIGSCVAELLVRQGVEDITLWDFDIVESHNVVNQLYTNEDINKPKTEALKEHLLEINPILKDTLKIKGEYTKEILNGFVFLCVDSIKVRKLVVENNFNNFNIEVLFDFRMTLTDGQLFTARWNNLKEKQSILDSLDFTDEEAKELTPTSACGFELSVAPTVRIITSLGIANFTNYINENKIKTLILSNPYDYNFLTI